MLPRVRLLLLALALGSCPQYAAAQGLTGRVLVVPFDNRQHDPAAALAVRSVGGAAGRRVAGPRRRRHHPRRAGARVRAAASSAVGFAQPRHRDQGRTSWSAPRGDRRDATRSSGETLKVRGAQDPDRRRPPAARRLERGAAQRSVRDVRRSCASARAGRAAASRRPSAHGRRSARSRTTSKGLIAESPAAQATFLETAVRMFAGYDRARTRAVGCADRTGGSCGGAGRGASRRPGTRRLARARVSWPACRCST